MPVPASNSVAGDDDEVPACPECDAADVRNRQCTKPTSGTSNDSGYRCGTCGHLFDEPAWRPRKGHASPGVGSRLAAKLAGMHPDDVGGGSRAGD